MTRTYLPAAIGETAISILATVAHTTDSQLAKRLLAVCERRCSPLVGSLPCPAALFFEATEGAYGTPERTLSENSLFRLYTQGMCSSMQLRAERQLIVGTRSRTCFPRLPVFIECGNRFGLQCPECARDAYETYGRRVSYCCHCVQFVTRCPLHECDLYCDDECSSLESLLSRCHEPRAARNAVGYARVARQLTFDCPHGRGRAEVQRRLLSKGFITETGRVRVTELDDAFTKLFSARFEDVRLNELVQRKDFIQTCVRALMREERAMHPVLLILMEWLASEVEAIRSAPSVRRRRTVATDDTVRATPIGTRFQPMPEQLQAKRSEWSDHRERCTGMSRTQMRRLLPGTWAWLYRHDRDWLTRNQSPRNRPIPKRALAEMPQPVSEVIRSNQRDLRCHNAGLLALPSAYQTRLAYGMSDYRFERAADVFNGAGKKAALPAAREAFVERRVAGAMAELSAAGASLDIATVARRARLRISTVEKYRRL